MTKIPNDPMILLSYINTQLRDFYPDMEELCRALGVEREAVDRRLAAVDYVYDRERNQYV